MNYRPFMQNGVMSGAGSFPRFNNEMQIESNSKILGYLGRSLSLEFTSGQHYLAQASLAKFRNETHYAQGFVTLANEEFQHANLITDRIISHGALPAGSVLSPSTYSGSVVEALKSCEAREVALIQLYGEAAQYCMNMGAAEDGALFNQLFEEEQAQLARITSWIEEYYHTMNAGPNISRSFA